MSPGHPNHYPNNLHQTYPITVPRGQIIDIRFTAFNIEWKSSYCQNDYLTIKEGRGRTLLEPSCGRPYILPHVTSNTNKVRVIFHTDGGGTDSGWRLEWIARNPGISLREFFVYRVKFGKIHI